jgi:hypothetical protein
MDKYFICEGCGTCYHTLPTQGTCIERMYPGVCGGHLVAQVGKLRPAYVSVAPAPTCSRCGKGYQHPLQGGCTCGD